MGEPQGLGQGGNVRIVQGMLEWNLLPCGACSPVGEPRAGPGGFCLPVLGRRQAQIPTGTQRRLTARPACLLWLKRLPEEKYRLLRH